MIFVLRFSLPESPRWLATHGQGQRALDLLQRMGLRTVPLASLRTGAASDTKSDPLGIVLREYPGRVIAGMICFFAFFGIALGLGAWLPNILVERGFPIAKSLNSIFWITLAFPCASAFMMYSLERFGPARWHLGARLSQRAGAALPRRALNRSPAQIASPFLFLARDLPPGRSEKRGASGSVWRRLT